MMINPRWDRLIVLLEDPVLRMVSKDFIKPLKRIVLRRYVFYDPVSGKEIYKCWVPPEGDYSEDEIGRMLETCRRAGVRFQRRLPKEG